MGYCYDMKTGRLCCDACHSHSGVRKCPCPFGWCQPIALCPECREKHKDKRSKAHHRSKGCESESVKERERRQREANLLEQGFAVRCSAVCDGFNLVKVWFRRRDSSTELRWMTSETYHAFALLEPTTVEDYERFGTVWRSKDEGVPHGAASHS